MTAGKTLWNRVRGDVIGAEAWVDTPFGKRLLTYADYTASGRGLYHIERYLERMLRHYANTHTEDDSTGAISTERLHRAETSIKRLLGAGEEYKIVAVGSGTTGAIHRLQQMLGVYIPPVARERLAELYDSFFPDSAERDRFLKHLRRAAPVVFVGPYEHHSNEVSWRECFAEVVEIDLTPEGLFDVGDLEWKLADPRYAGRMKIGSFSAASNVTGVRTPVFEVAEILHRHQALAFFDFAAIAPYARIRICASPECRFDAVFFAPHKFLGGPGASGILIFHQDIYRADLPPTIGAGGTVDFVNFDDQKYTPDIEAREKPGTPGILQTLKAALVLELKERLGPAEIESREADLISRAFARLAKTRSVEIVGNQDPSKRIAILSFNIRSGDSYLHPRFVVGLLNDLFGIQARAGCSCAGPYGHRLLGIDNRKSLQYKEIIMGGKAGIKPGWARLNFHFLMTDAEFDFLCSAIEFVADNGKYFLPLYKFDLASGGFHHRSFKRAHETFNIDEALDDAGASSDGPAPAPRERYLAEAKGLAARLRATFDESCLATTEKELIPFVYHAGNG